MKLNRHKPVLGVTLGDPCGIGPEVVLRALATRRTSSAARFVLFGSKEILSRVAQRFHLPLPPLIQIKPGDALNSRSGVFLLDEVSCPSKLALLGKATVAGGRASVAWVESAVEHALNDYIDGIVTAPISKEAIHKAGFNWPGHTELIACQSGVSKPIMMMVGGGLNVALVTTHAAIADVPHLITRSNVLATLRITVRDLRRYFGVRRPRIAVCGLNPHAGEMGQFGQEETGAIRPAIRQAQKEGLACFGPIPADTAYTRKQLARYDAIVAMFHDQATIPVKMLAFEQGVNVTLGLPIVRTSPDHGTAYDIVRKGVADAGSMIEAILLAAQMARTRRAGTDKRL